MRELLENLIRDENLKHLDFEDIGGGDIVRRIRPTLLSDVVRNLQTVNLSKCGLTKRQIRELLGEGLQGDFKLRSLNISFNRKLSLVQTELISSFANLHTLNVSGCDLSPSQLSILFRDIRDGNCVRELDLSQVSLELIWSVSRLARLNLSYSGLSQERIVVLLTNLYVVPVVRTTLDIRQNLQPLQRAAIREEARKLNIMEMLKI